MITVDEIQKRLNAIQVTLSQAERAALGARINCDRVVANVSQVMGSSDDETPIATMFGSLVAAHQLVVDAHKIVVDLYTEAQKVGAEMDAFLKEER